MQRTRLQALRDDVLTRATEQFRRIDAVAARNTEKVLDAMRACRVSDAHFGVSFGYAYSDLGREKLDELYARVFGAERALVRTQFVSGTHALATVLFGILRPGDGITRAAARSKSSASNTTRCRCWVVRSTWTASHASSHPGRRSR